MSLGPFLWRYFRPYWPVASVAAVTVVVYAVTTILLLAIFQPILAEVLVADSQALQGTPLASMAKEKEAVDTAADAAPTTVFERLKKAVDLQGNFDRFYNGLKARLGIDASNVVYFLPALFVAIFLLRSFSDFFNNYLFQVIGLGATNDLRSDLYQRLLHQSARFYSDHPSGELVSRVSNDISVMQNAVTNRLLDLFQQSLTLIGMIWFLLSIHLKLALVCLLILPAIGYPFARFGKGMRRTSSRSQERLADLAGLVAEAVRGHRVVKAFGMERFELERFREAARKHLKVKLKSQLFAHGSGPVIETVAVLFAAGFLIYAGKEIRAGNLSPSQMVQFLVNLLMLYDPIRKINKVNLILQEALAAAARVKNIMDVPNAIESSPDARELATDWKKITFEAVEFSYDEEPVRGEGARGERSRGAVLRGLDIEIERGQVVALVGPSGAGKSTLVNLVPRFFDPTGGHVRIDGNDLRELSLESLRAQIALVTQDTILFAGSVRDNIAYGRQDLSLAAVKEAARAAYADDFIEELPQGYDTEIGESGFKLSGGQRQRLAIARALLKNPPILILDEATSHLDSEAESLVQGALQNLMSGRTALVIAHRLSTVQRADRILVLEGGRIVQDGTHEALLQEAGVYRRLYDLQFQELPAREDGTGEVGVTASTPSLEEGHSPCEA